LKDNKDKVSAEDYARYSAQYDTVLKINRVFESTNDAELDEAQAKVVVDLMQQMQGHGNPPAELMDDMVPGMEVGADGLPNMPEGVPDCKSM
jgi:peroxin-19